MLAATVVVEALIHIVTVRSIFVEGEALRARAAMGPRFIFTQLSTAPIVGGTFIDVTAPCAIRFQRITSPAATGEAAGGIEACVLAATIVL